ncbi:MAG: hypothetical protein HQ518_09690 [Rhodopirellula sp.]|nr:hypothetical protein [Rhodopirellula sp.]
MSDSIAIQTYDGHANQSWQQPLKVLLACVTAISFFQPAVVTAQQESIGPVGSSVNQPSNIADGERILVLRTGRVMKGRIKSISTGWLVSTDRGNAVIPFEQVHFDADDLSEAYLRLRIQYGKPTVASHLRLAEWCLSQNILAEAARELRDALEKDSSNETARLMLNRVDNEIRRRTPPEPETEQPTDVVILTEQSLGDAEVEEVQSLSGLSPETAREFVASIQPLLLNKCGNARCHGPAAENDFQLTRLRSGASNSRIVSERNLAAVLNDLQPGQNGRARLLEVIRGSHAGQTIFNGRYGAVQMQTLQQWVQVAAKELRFELQSVKKTAFSNQPPAALSQRSANEATSATVKTTPERIGNDDLHSVTDAAEFSAETVNVDSNSAESAAIPSPSPAQGFGNTAGIGINPAASPTPLSNVQRLLQEARQHVRKQDAFDPEDFNRRFAGSRTP